jgi:hypothetical protein
LREDERKEPERNGKESERGRCFRLLEILIEVEVPVVVNSKKMFGTVTGTILLFTVRVSEYKTARVHARHQARQHVSIIKAKCR